MILVAAACTSSAPTEAEAPTCPAADGATDSGAGPDSGGDTDSGVIRIRGGDTDSGGDTAQPGMPDAPGEDQSARMTLCGPWSGTNNGGQVDRALMTDGVDATTGDVVMTGVGTGEGEFWGDPNDAEPDGIRHVARTRTLRCDAQGRWLVSDLSLVTEIHRSGTSSLTGDEGVSCLLDEGPLIIPADTAVGSTWSSTCAGTAISYPWSYRPDDCEHHFTVPGVERIETHAGYWDALRVEVTTEGTRRWPQKTFWLGHGAGIVAWSDWELIEN